MKNLFTQIAQLRINNTITYDFLQKLPELIYRHTHWEYKQQQENGCCLLKPTFRNMLYRNSFIPEINITLSPYEEYTTLHITGRPAKSVRILMAFWFSFLSLMEVVLLLGAITSNLDSITPVFIPIAMGAFGYLLCKLATKANFKSVVRVIQTECL